MDVGRVLTSIDKVADYVPVVSTVTNLVDLFQKCVVIPCMSREAIDGSRYYTHLSQKSVLRSIVLLLPVIGNLVIGIMDLQRISYEECVSRGQDHQCVYRLRGCTPEQKDHVRFVLRHAEHDYRALQYASDRLRDNQEFMLRTFREANLDESEFPYPRKAAGYRVLEYASDRLKGDEKFMLEAFSKDPKSLVYASENLIESTSFMREMHFKK